MNSQQTYFINRFIYTAVCLNPVLYRRDFYIDSGFLCNITNTCYDLVVGVLMNAKIFARYNTLIVHYNEIPTIL